MAVHMLHGTQFNISFILIATSVVAVLLAFGQVWPVAFLIGQFLFVYLGSEYLCRNLPISVRTLQTANCARADGSHSQHRSSVERKELWSLRSNLRLLLFIGIAPSLLLLWYDSFEMDKVAIFSAIWLVAAFLIVRSGYLYFLNQFVFHLKRRTQQYKLRDLDMFIREEEMVADRNREKHQLIEDATTSQPNNSIRLSPRSD